MKRGVAEQSLNTLITQSALTQAALAMHLTVPDEALRQAIFQVPAFKGPNGQFDRQLFQQTLANNNMSEAGFMSLLRLDMLRRQLLQTVGAGAVAPDVLTREIFAFQQEKRLADAVGLPFAAAPPPPAPTDAQLTRWYENHTDQYSTPEYRRIKAVILSPETVAKEVQVTDEDLRGAYEQVKANYNQPEKRSAEVVLLPDEAKANALVAQWSGGADWPAIKAAADKEGATAVDLTDSTPEQIPSPELAAAVFAAAPDVVLPPVKTALGWYAVKVTHIVPATAKTLEEVRDELRKQVIAEKAADMIYDRANKIDDLLSGGVPLDNLPGDLGLAAVTGTLDAQGDTLDGQPAPIPGDATLRDALIKAAFQTKPGDPPRLVRAGPENADDGYYALTVEDILPPKPRPFADVADRVRADWTRDAIHHEQEAAAARILSEVKSGQTLEAAALGLSVQHLPPVSRGATPQVVPMQLVEPLFSLKVGEPTMIEDADGFMVAVLSKIETPDAASDPIDYGRIREALTQSVANDMEAIFTAAVREGAHPQVNRPVFNSLIRND
jgi:peptidyl-prolyl cis-trans isomerase D